MFVRPLMVQQGTQGTVNAELLPDIVRRLACGNLTVPSYASMVKENHGA